MPAAAVIPAPIAYIKVVAVKKLVVEFQGLALDCLRVDSTQALPLRIGVPLTGRRSSLSLYCEKIRVFKASLA